MDYKIATFLRLRPTKKTLCHYELVDEAQGMVVEVPRENMNTEVINNTKERYEFRFSKVFDKDARQEDVFTSVALPTVTAALDGFNGTIFAYGQTGSGKTFTITGGPEKYEDRGIIPRVLSHIFNEFKRRSDWSYQAHFSYLEIYNDAGYDLLDPSLEDNAKALEDLPRVILQEDEGGNIHLKNLSAHKATTEEEALNLLFLGDTNRTTSETPMNLASSRSHCIFTIFITAAKVGSDIIRKSKMHLVDLAGSERVYKTGATGALLRESKYINTSLHFLETVIVALQERSQGKARSHVPYRNSMMTSVLRDSLGGNCKTSMIATMNPDKAHTDESMSTCRFAQRVAMVSNAVKVNEEVDPQLVIRRLKKEVIELREEIALLKGADEEAGPISDETAGHIRKMVEQFVSDPSPESELSVGPNMAKIRMCFALLKEMVQDGGGPGKKGGGGGGGGGGGPGSEEMEEKVRKLTGQLKQRDNEIVILVNMINEAKKNGVVVSGPGAEGVRGVSAGGAMEGAGKGEGGAGGEPQAPLVDPSILKDRQKAFEMFRGTYHKNEAIESNKVVLKSKYDEAKSVGEAVNESRSEISKLKAQIEQLRVERAMQGEGSEATEAENEEEMKVKEMIDTHKARYKDKFNRLRELKAEIEQIQSIMEKQRSVLQKDFESWYNLMVRQYKQQLRGGASASIDSAAALSPSPSAQQAPQSQQPSVSASFNGAMSMPASIGGQSSGASSKLAAPGAGSGDPAPVLTGNRDADADIAAFYKARQQLLDKPKQ